MHFKLETFSIGSAEGWEPRAPPFPSYPPERFGKVYAKSVTNKGLRLKVLANLVRGRGHEPLHIEIPSEKIEYALPKLRVTNSLQISINFVTG